MTQSKKIILLTTSLILTICLMAFFGVYALTTLKNSTFNVGVKYELEYLVKVEMWIDGANGGTEDKIIDDKEYVEIFNSLNPVSNGMYIDSMSNDTIRINSQTLTPIGENGDVYFRITSLENATSGNKDLRCVINCGSATEDSGKIVSNETKILTISTGLDSRNVTPASSSLGMIKINLKFSEFLLDLKDLSKHDATVLYFGEADTIETSPISGTTFYVSDINGLLKLSALVGQVDTTTTAYGADCGYKNSAGPAVTFEGATIQMLNNIDCGNTSAFTNAKTFIPIGNEANSFRGTFDGNDKTITGLYINQTTDNAGLFGYIFDAEIKNLKMQNCKVVSKGEHVGNVVGYANGVIISNCSAEKTEVSGSSDYVGGIVGRVWTSVSITNCYNTGSVSGGSDVGGIVGDVLEATITNCYNTGSVSGDRDVGGIVGNVAEATITNCYNTESVSGSSYVGGIIGFCGYSNIVAITNCYNTGSVGGSSSSRVGGIVGDIDEDGQSTITNCYNTGSVGGSSSSRVGGIVGNVDDAATITNCYYLQTDDVNASLKGVGYCGWRLISTSYFGTFSSAGSELKPCSDSPSSDLAYGKTDLLTVLDKYRDANSPYNGIDLKSWVDGSNGYPVFEL